MACMVTCARVSGTTPDAMHGLSQHASVWCGFGWICTCTWPRNQQKGKKREEEETDWTETETKTEHIAANMLGEPRVGPGKVT